MLDIFQNSVSKVKFHYQIRIIVRYLQSEMALHGNSQSSFFLGVFTILASRECCPSLAIATICPDCSDNHLAGGGRYSGGALVYVAPLASFNGYKPERGGRPDWKWQTNSYRILFDLLTGLYGS